MKRTIGRGPRINEASNKLIFTLMYFERATALVADPDFEGVPVQNYEPKAGETVVPQVTLDDFEKSLHQDLPPYGSQAGTFAGEDASGSKPVKYFVDNVEVRVATERVQDRDEHGTLNTESLKDFSRKALRKADRPTADLPPAWQGGEP